MSVGAVQLETGECRQIFRAHRGRLGDRRRRAPRAGWGPDNRARRAGAESLGKPVSRSLRRLSPPNGWSSCGLGIDAETAMQTENHRSRPGLCIRHGDPAVKRNQTRPTDNSPCAWSSPMSGRTPAWPRRAVASVVADLVPAEDEQEAFVPAVLLVDELGSDAAAPGHPRGAAARQGPTMG
jgi:hypothetical protein